MERVRRRWWTAAITLAALIVVLGALITATFQLVMLVAPGYREDLADYVSHIAGQPVDIGGVGLGWRGLAPRLELTDITLYGEDEHSPALAVERLRLGFGLSRLFHGDTMPNRVELSGLELFAQIDEDGKFSLRGLDSSGMPARASQEWLRQLGRFQSVRLSRCELQLDDARLRGPKPRFRLIDAEVEFANGRGEASAELSLPPSMGSSVTLEAAIAGDLDRPETWNGRWTADVEGLTSLPWLNVLLAEDAAVGFRDTELRVDGTVVRGALGASEIRLDADAVMGRRQSREAMLTDISMAARLVPQARGWQLDIERLGVKGERGAWPTTQARVRLVREEEGPSNIDAEASFLRLSDLTPWLALLPDDGVGAQADRLRGISGALRRLVLRWSGAYEQNPPRYSLRADLDELALAGNGKLPGFDGLSGELYATENGGKLTLKESPFELLYPRVFAQTVGFESVSGELSWSRTGAGWDLRVPRLGWQLDGSKGEGNLALSLPAAGGGSPSIKLDARFSAADVTRMKRYLPVIWPDNLREWINRAIVAGRAPSGRLRIEGELADFPFIEKPGLFALDIDAADARFAFAPDWPEVEKLAAHLEFRGNSLAIRGVSGVVMGNRVEHVEALIPDLREGELSLHAEVQGDAARFYDFLNASPLAPRLSGLLTRTKAQGDSVVMVDLDIPIKHSKDTQVSGEVQMRGVQLEVVGVPEPVMDLRGDLSFDNHTVEGEGLTAQMYAAPLTGSIGRDPDNVLRVRGDFDFVPDAAGTGASQLLPAFLRRNLSGSSRWQALVTLDGPDAGRVSLNSTLQGMAVSLPKPMDKTADAVWPLKVDLTSEKNFPLRLAIDMQERLGGELAFARDTGNGLRLQRARFRAGAGAAPHAGDDGIFITGTVADLEPLRWAATVSRSDDGGQPPQTSGTGALPLSAELNVGHLWLGQQQIDGVRVSQAPAAGGWTTRVSGNGAQGEVGFKDAADGGVISGRFDRVQIAARPMQSEAVHKAGEDPEKNEDKDQPLDPARAPRLDFQIQDLRIGSAELGKLDLRTQRIAEGQRIEQLRAVGGGGQLEASGEWRRSAGRSAASMQFSLETNAIEELLVSLGYAPSLKAKRARFRGQLAWPAQLATAPRGLRWTMAEGHLDLDIEKGALRSVEPGAGRVLGLINFWALPRRLTLDFRDVLSEGLSFDEIKGRFNVGKGVAATDNLDIEAPSLKMEIRGKVGLAARDYDQRVTVYPDVSAGVTLGALLLGGPAAGVLALIAQEVLDQPLDQVGQLSYRLTGGWDDPQVVREGGLLPGSGSPTPAPTTPAPAPTPIPAPSATRPATSTPFAPRTLTTP